MTNQIRRDAIEERALARIRAEYLEMPGMQLTLAQACRLFRLEEQAGRHTLDALVDASFLRRAGGLYARADSGRGSL